MGCGSEKALKANVPNSHPGLLLRTLEYRLLVAESINGTQVCSAYHPENHFKIAITVAIFPILSTLFHLAHWWEHEKKEHGGLGRLRTLPQLSESMVAKIAGTETLSQH